MLRSSSKLESSLKKFKIGDMTKITNKEITIGDVTRRSMFDRVSLAAKVLRIDDSVEVSGGLKKLYWPTLSIHTIEIPMTASHH